MSLEALLINGPGGAGKTRVARLVAEHVVDRPVHYLRMRPASDGYTNVVVEADDAVAGGPMSRPWGSVHIVTYTDDRVFETLPEGLRAVRRVDNIGGQGLPPFSTQRIAPGLVPVLGPIFRRCTRFFVV